MIHQEQHGSATLLQIKHGKINALDADLLEAFLETLSALGKSQPAAVIITGSGESFCAGANLKKMLEGEDYLKRFMPLLSETLTTLFSFPYPTVAAINGHAIAAGYFLAACCDYKIMAERPLKVGVPELKLGMFFPAIMQELLNFAIPKSCIQEMIYTGRLYNPTEALARGMLDRLVDTKHLNDSAQKIALELANIPRASFTKTKEQLRKKTLESAKTYAKEHDQALIATLASEDTQKRIRKHLDGGYSSI